MSQSPLTNPTDKSGRRHIAFWLVLLVLSVAAEAYFRMLIGVETVDDEGTMMITVKLYLAGGRIYQDVVSRYGPVYYFYQLLIHTLTATPVSHDVTRFMSIFHW